MFLVSRSLSSQLTNACRRMVIGGSLVVLATLPAAASAQTWNGALVGTNEVPANSSPASGFVTMSLTGSILNVALNWSGLTGGNVVAGHIHCCVAPGSNVGVAVGFNGLSPAASGSYTSSFDLNNLGIYTNTFVTNFGSGTAAGSQAALINGLNSGLAYVNLHNAAFPGGEIRANVVTTTPEPASMVLMGFGLAGVALAVRRRSRAS